MTHIRQLNADLRELVNGERKPSSGSTLPAVNKSLITYHKWIQHHARLLYLVLCEKFEPPICICVTPHSPHLELRMRSKPPNSRNKSTLQADYSHNNSPNQLWHLALCFRHITVVMGVRQCCTSFNLSSFALMISMITVKTSLAEGNRRKVALWIPKIQQ